MDDALPKKAGGGERRKKIFPDIKKKKPKKIFSGYKTVT
jgi:hypothetical protein